MLPRLQAEEELRDIRAGSVPFVKRADRDRYLRSLERRANAGRRRAKATTNVDDLKAIGIRVEHR